MSERVLEVLEPNPQQKNVTVEVISTLRAGEVIELIVCGGAFPDDYVAKVLEFDGECGSAVLERRKLNTSGINFKGRNVNFTKDQITYIYR